MVGAEVFWIKIMTQSLPPPNAAPFTPENPAKTVWRKSIIHSMHSAIPAKIIFALKPMKIGKHFLTVTMTAAFLAARWNVPPYKD
ncbi:MAG: hypothetical protein CO093_08720 [Alphaproteobacteria bacterium CG_4_9_14_3_um_filter_47_13]|nr:MAG: hypothetical protein CO093_08720 [Alphaproteobacteria bacterium CG_4_9_14_3_um_filter_47_13]